MSAPSTTSNSQIILLVFVCYFVYVYNKKCVTYQYIHLLDEFGLTEQDAGLISSSQQISISLLTFFGGILTDFIPASVLFPFGLILCGLTTFLFPFGSTTGYFSFIWFLNGIGHGLELPTALRLTKQLSSPSTFATNWSFVLVSINVAGVLNPLLSTYFASAFGWKISVLISASVTLAVGLVSFYLFNRIDKLRSVTDNQSNNNKKTDIKSTESLTLASVLMLPFLWILIANRFVGALSRLSVIDWSQIYFTTEKNLTRYHGGLFVSTFEFSSIFGKLLGGRINDYCINRFLPRLKSAPAVRFPIMVALHTLNACSLMLYWHYLNASSSIYFMMLVAVLCGLFSAGNVVTMSVLSTEISPSKKHEGLVTSICNLATKIGSLCSGYPFTLIAFWFDWGTSFASIIWLLMCTIMVDSIFYKNMKTYKID